METLEREREREGDEESENEIHLSRRRLCESPPNALNPSAHSYAYANYYYRTTTGLRYNLLRRRVNVYVYVYICLVAKCFYWLLDRARDRGLTDLTDVPIYRGQRRSDNVMKYRCVGTFVVCTHSTRLCFGFVEKLWKNHNFRSFRSKNACVHTRMCLLHIHLKILQIFHGRSSPMKYL